MPVDGSDAKSNFLNLSISQLAILAATDSKLTARVLIKVPAVERRMVTMARTIKIKRRTSIKVKPPSSRWLFALGDPFLWDI